MVFQPACVISGIEINQRQYPQTEVVITREKRVSSNRRCFNWIIRFYRGMMTIDAREVHRGHDEGKSNPRTLFPSSRQAPPPKKQLPAPPYTGLPWLSSVTRGDDPRSATVRRMERTWTFFRSARTAPKYYGAMAIFRRHSISAALARLAACSGAAGPRRSGHPSTR